MIRITVELLNEAGEVENVMFSEEEDGLQSGLALITMREMGGEIKKMGTLIHGMTAMHIMEGIAGSKPFMLAAKFMPMYLEERQMMVETEGANATTETCDSQCQ